MGLQHGSVGGLAQYGRGGYGGFLSGGQQRLPECRPKMTSSFPGLVSGLSSMAQQKHLRSNGFGRFPPTTAHKHVFGTGRNVRVHEMPPRVKGDC